MMKIDDIIGMIHDSNKRLNTLKAFKKYEDVFSVEFASDGIDQQHQVYIGGLQDHTILVCITTIITIKRMVNEIFYHFDMDDIIISCIFHDFDKLNKYIEKDPIFPTHRDIIEYLDEHLLVNKDVRDGILHSHGGWSKFSDDNHGLIGIILHFADMFASQIIKTEDSTKRMIGDLSKYMIDTDNNNNQRKNVKTIHMTE